MESGHQNDPEGDNNNLNNQDVTSIKSISLFTSVVFGIMTVVKKQVRLSTFIPSALKFLKLLLYFLVDCFLRNSVVCSNKAAAANICAHDQRSCKSFRLGVNLVLMP